MQSNWKERVHTIFDVIYIENSNYVKVMKTDYSFIASISLKKKKDELNLKLNSFKRKKYWSQMLGGGKEFFSEYDELMSVSGH